MHSMDLTQLETDETRELPYASEEAFSGPLSPAEELAEASDLLEINEEEQLEEFLGGILSRATGGARRFASSPRGQAVGRYLRSAIKEALPGLGRAIGDQVHPGLGGAGARLGRDAGVVLGLEMEGLSKEDKEFEVARQLVRLAAEAAHLANLAARDADPDDIGREAVATAARTYAPGLLPRLHGRSDSEGQVVSPLSEEEEDQLAEEMLDVDNEEGFDKFLGKVMRKAHQPAAHRPGPQRHGGHHPGAGTRKPAGRSAGAAAFLRSPAAQALGGILKQVAKQALPVVGGAIGTAIMPGIGTSIGTDLGSAASGLFEIEPGSMSEEEAEFETARRFVGLSAAATHHLAGNPQAAARPQVAAWDAVLTSAGQYAPGLHRQLLGHPGNGHHRRHRHGQHHDGHHGAAAGVEFPFLGEPVVEVLDVSGPDGPLTASGTWERRGRRIILHGV